MDIQKLTKYFIITTFVLIAVYDVYAWIKGGTAGTISYAMIDWSYKYPIWPFAMGIICGHLFWRVRDVKRNS